MTRILLLDNFDSFTYNLVHYLESSGCEVTVVRNNQPVPDFEGYAGLVLSPGPGLPAESGNLNQTLATAVAAQLPVLGVCLGMQAICEHFGGNLININPVLHGVATISSVVLDDRLFAGLPAQFSVGHYHSWACEEFTLPEELQILAKNSTGLPMAIRHLALPIRGVQFHPESLLTPHGKQLIGNWVQML